MRTLEKKFGNFFSALFQIFCVKRPDGMFGDVRTVIMNVRTIRFIRPDISGSCPDGHVFATIYVAQHPDVTYVPSGR
jgi:hypothetical protein